MHSSKIRIIFLLVLIIIILLSFIIIKINAYLVNKNKKKEYIIKQEKPPCPVCGSRLYTNDNIKSVVYKSELDEQVCHIHGCPHCYPTLKEGIKRHCPVCKKEISINGYLVARLYTKKNLKKHIHIVGCNNCR